LALALEADVLVSINTLGASATNLDMVRMSGRATAHMMKKDVIRLIDAKTAFGVALNDEVLTHACACPLPKEECAICREVYQDVSTRLKTARLQPLRETLSDKIGLWYFDQRYRVRKKIWQLRGAHGPKPKWNDWIKEDYERTEEGRKILSDWINKK